VEVCRGVFLGASVEMFVEALSVCLCAHRGIFPHLENAESGSALNSFSARFLRAESMPPNPPKTPPPPSSPFPILTAETAHVLPPSACPARPGR
jgi:hypothetical protein